MSLDLQAKLLRVIEAGEILRIGETRVTRVNVRIIAATHRDLKSSIENGSFREDLYYRISAFQIGLPPLRERMEDIPLFALHFLQVYCLKTKKKVERISGEYMTALQRHDWKGNIRELKNVVERSVILTSGDELSTDSLPPEFESVAFQDKGKSLSAFELAGAEKIHIQKVLNYTHGNKTKAAELLHIALTTLYRKMEEYSIK